VRRILTVLADPDRLRIVEGEAIVASHPRSFDKGQQIEIQAHVRALVAWKRQARRHRATDRLAQAAPASRTLLVRAAERASSMPPSARRSSVVCRIPTRFVWRSNAAATTAARTRLSPSLCQRVSAGVTRPCVPIRSRPTIN
jgi:hypothetical protein